MDHQQRNVADKIGLIFKLDGKEGKETKSSLSVNAIIKDSRVAQITQISLPNSLQCLKETGERRQLQHSSTISQHLERENLKGSSWRFLEPSARISKRTGMIPKYT